MEERRAPATLDLLDWKRRVAELYGVIRSAAEPRAAWDRWREVRHELITRHAESPIVEPARRAAFQGPWYFDYDPAFRVTAAVEEAEHEDVDVVTSGDGTYSMTRFATAWFELGGAPRSLDLFWIGGYGGGLFLSFRDATSGSETYGACRYLLDTIKGADLGTDDGGLVLDFNFAYQPSCSYDPRWVCPLAPPQNRLALPVTAGERLDPG